jgi:hypothetical protein
MTMRLRAADLLPSFNCHVYNEHIYITKFVFVVKVHIEVKIGLNSHTSCAIHRSDEDSDDRKEVKVRRIVSRDG